jgi:acyl-CoA synthetase (NDP forming)
VAANSLLTSLFEPRSIAVVGASGNAAKLGAQVFERLAVQFKGPLHAVNPAQTEIAGRRAFASVRDLPGPIDLLVMLTPADALVATVEQLVPGQVRNVVAVSSGFAEVAQGAQFQERLGVAARKAGVRVVGPNVVGVLSPITGLNASIIPLMPPGGSPGLGVVTQSGGFGMALAMYACDCLMSVSRFCDVGNTADVSAGEIVDALAEDPATGVIGVFIESVRDRALFDRSLLAAAARKPVVLCTVGRTPAGSTASLAHVGIKPDWMTGAALPGGVLAVATGQELLTAANAALWHARRVAGKRVAIVTGTGGIGSELADLAHESGLIVPAFSAGLRAQLAGLLPSYAGTGNPVDMTPIWRDYPVVYPEVISAISKSGEADMIAVSITDVPTAIPDLAASLARAAATPGILPMVAFWGSRDGDLANALAMREARIPLYRSTRDAINACAALAFFARASD